jgi:ParB family chromosome partitioning protein
MSKSKDLLERFGANIAQTVAPRAGGAPEPARLAPDKYDGAVKARSFAEMPVDAIDADLQPRTEFDQVELERLAASIKRFGQLAPIRIRHDATRGKWVVLVGERRLRACRIAGLKTVRVEFVERDMTEADVLAEQVVENAVRSDLRPVEQGRAYDRLLALNGWTVEQLAETIGVEATSVHRSIGLLRLPEDVADQVDAGKIKATAAYEISKLQIADDQRRVAEKVVAEGLDHKATVFEVSRRRSEKTTARRRTKAAGKTRLPAEQRFRGSRGVRVVVHTTGKHTLADVVQDLRELIARLEQESAAA